jgi:hypothetical protein
MPKKNTDAVPEKGEKKNMPKNEAKGGKGGKADKKAEKPS